MEPLTYANIAPRALRRDQAVKFGASVALSILALVVSWRNQDKNSTCLAWYIVFILSDAALAVMLLIWRKRVHPVVAIIGWLWVGLGALTLLVVLGTNTGLLVDPP
jgi:hypothetical protein